MTVPVHGLPPLLHEGLVVAAVPPALKGSRWLTVEEASLGDGPGQLVSFSSMGSIGDAEALVGKVLLANTADLPADYALHDVDALLGRPVEDGVYGPLGTITEVMRGVANDVWVIDGPYGEVLIPVVDEVVGQVASQGKILVQAPRGTIATELREDECSDGEV